MKNKAHKGKVTHEHYLEMTGGHTATKQTLYNKKAMPSQGNRAMPQLFVAV